MKQFYFKIDKSNPRTYGGRNVTASVYLVKKGQMNKIGEIKWNTASYKGAESEVLDFLIDKKLAKLKDFPTKYYSWRDAEKAGVNISEL